MFRHCKKVFDISFNVEFYQGFKFFQQDFRINLQKKTFFFCFCLLLWNSQRLERLRQLNGRAATKAATSRLLSGSDEDGKGRGKWTLRNKVAALLQLWWSIRKEKDGRRRGKWGIMLLCVCLDVKMEWNCKSQRNTHLRCLALMLRGWDKKKFVDITDTFANKKNMEPWLTINSIFKIFDNNNHFNKYTPFWPSLLLLHCSSKRL